MTKHIAFERTAAALRDLDPAPTTTLTRDERRHANATLTRILATPGHEHIPTKTVRPRRHRSRVLIPLGLLTAAAVAVSTVLGSGSAFASWTATPAPLPASDAAAAATACRSTLSIPDQSGIPDQSARIALGERRGGWTYILLDGPGWERACLMPDDLIGASDAEIRKDRRFFGSFSYDPPEAPTPARDGIIQTEIMGGSVPPPRAVPLITRYSWFSWVTGYAGSDVTAVTVHPPVGPDVQASIKDGRYSAWWPAGEARGDNPGVSGASTYSVSLADGTTRRVNAQQ